jgi:DNA-binding SARP family transcriptional activator
MLAYLALEGSAHKYRLAGWLWPDSGEEAAKNNMRQLLRRLRLGAGEVVRGDDHIELASGVEVDVRHLSYIEAPSLELLRQDANLLEGLEYDDAPVFEEWLTVAREELRQLRVRSARAEAERLEVAGDHKEALEYAQVWVRIEPFSEEAHRLLIRLHYLLGDRGAALSAFEGLKTLLDNELGIEPLPETVALARMVERGGQLPGARPQPKETALPTAVLRPPILAGREAEWARLEAAWSAGQFIAIGSQGGLGKTRLMLDFIHSKVPSESVLHLQARPGDAQIPYSSHARNFEKMVDQFQPDLEPWVQRELSRIIPKLANLAAPPLGPIQGEEEKLRFYRAKFEAMAASVHKGLRVLASDDVHYTDPQSAEAALYMMGLMGGTTGGLAAVYAYRQDELNPQIAAVIEGGAVAGLIAKIDLQPLDTEGTQDLLGGLGLGDHADLVPGLLRYTGGNPLFILETLKHLIETDTLSQGLPSRLAPPGKVAALVTRRLQRLSPQALNLARAAAVAGTSFDLKLATFVLERPAMELAEAHHELESAQILKGNAFTHDLVFEATLAGVPAAVLQVLHGRTAQHLETVQANPALLAVHWEATGDGDQAGHWLIRASEQAEDLGLYEDMVKHLERAAAVAAQTSLRLSAQARLANALGPLGRVEEAIALARSVLREAKEPQTRQRALSVLQNSYQILGRYAESEAFIDQGLELALQTGELDRAEGMRFAKALVRLRTGRYGGAIELLEHILPYYRSQPHSTDLLQVLTALGTSRCMAGRVAEALPLLLEARDMADASMGAPAVILAVSCLLYGKLCQGGSEELLGEAERLLEEGSYTIADHLRNNLALAYLRLNRAEDAARHYRVQTEKARDPNYVCAAWAWLAGLETHSAEATLNRAIEFYPQTSTPAAQFAAIQAAALHGSTGQKSWSVEELGKLERNKVPWLFLDDYDHLTATIAR